MFHYKCHNFPDINKTNLTSNPNIYQVSFLSWDSLLTQKQCIIWKKVSNKSLFISREKLNYAIVSRLRTSFQGYFKVKFFYIPEGSASLLDEFQFQFRYFGLFQFIPSLYIYCFFFFKQIYNTKKWNLRGCRYSCQENARHPFQ